jgi:hypothetical protein
MMTEGLFAATATSRPEDGGRKLRPGSPITVKDANSPAADLARVPPSHNVSRPPAGCQVTATRRDQAFWRASSTRQQPD